MNTIRSRLLALWIMHFCLDFFVGVWPVYKTIAGLDLAKAGFIVAIAGFLGETLQLLFGYLADRGLHKMLIILGLTLSSCICLIPYTSNYSLYFILLLFLYLGSGAFHPAAAGAMSCLSSGKQSLSMTFFTSGGQVGFALSQILFVWAFHAFKGHTLLLFIPIGICFFCIRKMEFGHKALSSKKNTLQDLIETFGKAKKELSLLYFSQVANQIVFYSLIFLLPDFLQQKGYSSALCLGGGHLCVVLGAALMMIPMGIIADRIGEKYPIYICSTLTIILIYSFLLWPPESELVTGGMLFIIGANLGALNPIFVAFGQRLFPNHLGTISAFLMGIAWSFSNLSYAVAGWLAKTASIAGALLAISGLLFVPLILVMQLELLLEKKRTAQLTPIRG